MIPLAVVLVAASALGSEAVPQAPPAAPPEAAAPARSKPSPDHERLDALVGRFRFERTNTIPGRPAEHTKGVSQNRWMLDDHYVECHLVEGDGGTGNESLMTYGFDLRRRVYFALVVASRATYYRNLEGFWDEAARSLVLLGKDPGDGSVAGPKLRMVVHIESRDRHGVEVFAIAPGRLPEKASEIVFVRE